jgi:acyl-CoA synthetase (NDP forming)
MDALVQFAEHCARMAKPARAPLAAVHQVGATRFLSEFESLAWLRSAGLPVIEHSLARTEDEAARAAALYEDGVVLKACSPDVAHKSEHGLVAFNPADARAEFRRQREKVKMLGGRFEGVIVARLASKGRELALGARLDPQFGPVVMLGDGGIYLEALKDFRLLMPPFTEEEVLQTLTELRIAPLLGAVRGEPARDVGAFAGMAVRLGEAMLASDAGVSSVDINPVIVFETGKGAVAVDALVECRL